MKTLLQINSVINWGSTGRIVEEIGQLAKAKGYSSYIAYGRNERPSQSQLIKIGSGFDIVMHGIYTRLFDRHGFGSYNVTQKLVKIIQVISPDIIHLHNLHGYYLNIQVLFDFLNRAGIPVVWTFHDCWPITGHCAYFDVIGCERWKTGCFNCPQKESYPRSVIMDNSKNNYAQKKELFRSVKRMILVPVSHWMNNILNNSYLNTYVNKIIHNGIDTDQFSPQPDNNIIRKKYLIGDSFIILGVAAVWDERKGLKDFIRLSERLSKDYIIVLVGLNKKQISGLSPKIIGISRTENIRELAALYSAADLYINPTWEDNFPTTNLEALACGTPVVTYNTGGSVDAISPQTGFIVEKGNINGLVEISSAVKETGKKFFSSTCRESAVRNFNKQSCFEKYIELYDSLT